MSSSGSSTFNSESSGSSSQISRSRIPFLEKYAQLVPMNNSRPTPPSSKSLNGQDTESPSSPKHRTSSSSRPSRPIATSTDQSRPTKPKTQKLLTPLTSPELSPSEKIGFASLQRSQLRNERAGLPSSNSMPFDNVKKNVQEPRPATKALAKSRALPSSQSASTGLDRLLASEAFSHPTLDDRHDYKPNQHETPKARGRPPQKTSRKASNVGLEDLMGDLMSEMSRKAEMSTYQLKAKKNRSTTSRNGSSPPVSPHKRSATESDAKFMSSHDTEGTSLRFNDCSPPIDILNSHMITLICFVNSVTPKTQVRNNSATDSPVVPDSPGIRPSDSISQLGYDHPPSPPPARALFTPAKRGDDRCHQCGKRTDSRSAKIRESSISKAGAVRAIFCHPCYAELYLPKCRKCDGPIERGAVTDRVGKVLGKYHSECFNCFKCSAKFPNGEFYVWDRKPVVR